MQTRIMNGFMHTFLVFPLLSFLSVTRNMYMLYYDLYRCVSCSLAWYLSCLGLFVLVSFSFTLRRLRPHSSFLSDAAIYLAESLYLYEFSLFSWVIHCYWSAESCTDESSLLFHCMPSRDLCSFCTSFGILPNNFRLINLTFTSISLHSFSIFSLRDHLLEQASVLRSDRLSVCQLRVYCYYCVVHCFRHCTS